jgi:2-methylfumaryl-CoA isomerase
VALAVTGHLGYLAEAQFSRADRPRIGNHLYGGFARDFVTRDDGRVMVVALTRRHFADLAAATGLTSTFAQLEQVLGADFGTDSDRYRHRELIAALLAPWFAARDIADIDRDLAGASVLWSPYHRFTDLTGSGKLAGNPLFAMIDQPGVGLLLAPGSPLAHRAGSSPVMPAPALGADTIGILTEMLGLTQQEACRLAERGIVGESGLSSARQWPCSWAGGVGDGFGGRARHPELPQSACRALDHLAVGDRARLPDPGLSRGVARAFCVMSSQFSVFMQSHRE